jgi:hypothetical protein
MSIDDEAPVRSTEGSLELASEVALGNNRIPREPLLAEKDSHMGLSLSILLIAPGPDAYWHRAEHLGEHVGRCDRRLSQARCDL